MKGIALFFKSIQFEKDCCMSMYRLLLSSLLKEEHRDPIDYEINENFFFNYLAQLISNKSLILEKGALAIGTFKAKEVSADSDSELEKSDSEQEDDLEIQRIKMIEEARENYAEFIDAPEKQYLINLYRMDHVEDLEDDEEQEEEKEDLYMKTFKENMLDKLEEEREMKKDMSIKALRWFENKKHKEKRKKEKENEMDPLIIDKVFGNKLLFSSRLARKNIHAMTLKQQKTEVSREGISNTSINSCFLAREDDQIDFDAYVRQKMSIRNVNPAMIKMCKDCKSFFKLQIISDLNLRKEKFQNCQKKKLFLDPEIYEVDLAHFWKKILKVSDKTYTQKNSRSFSSIKTVTQIEGKQKAGTKSSIKNIGTLSRVENKKKGEINNEAEIKIFSMLIIDDLFRKYENEHKFLFNNLLSPCFEVLLQKNIDFIIKLQSLKIFHSQLQYKFFQEYLVKTNFFHAHQAYVYYILDNIANQIKYESKPDQRGELLLMNI